MIKPEVQSDGTEVFVIHGKELQRDERLWSCLIPTSMLLITDGPGTCCRCKRFCSYASYAALDIFVNKKTNTLRSIIPNRCCATCCGLPKDFSIVTGIANYDSAMELIAGFKKALQSPVDDLAIGKAINSIHDNDMVWRKKMNASSALTKCINCKRPMAKAFKCGRCFSESYCSRACQKQRWKRVHKKHCKDRLHTPILLVHKASVYGE